MNIDRMKVIRLMSEQKMTVKSLCEKSGLSYTAFNRILKEQGSSRMTTALKLAITLNVDVDELIKAE